MIRHLPLIFLIACGEAPDHGHSHGSDAEAGHAHGGDDGLAFTRHIEGWELFVEFDPFEAGHPYAYHAHVTQSGALWTPVTDGSLTIRFEADGVDATPHTDPAPARTGIFAGEAKAPSSGRYELIVAYSGAGDPAEWSLGEVVIDGHHTTANTDDEGPIGFTKEAQWQVPFAMELAEARPLAPTVTASGVVEPDPATTAVVAAPAEGLVVWTGRLPVPGRRVTRGERLASLVPAREAEAWSRSQASLTSAEVALDLAEKELARVEELTARELLPARRLDEARAGVATARSEARAAERGLAALDSGGAAVAVRAPTDGLIIEVGAHHGEAVDAGTPLVTVAAGEDLLVQAHIYEPAAGTLRSDGLAVQRADWPTPRPVDGQLLSERAVGDPHHLSASIAVRMRDPDLAIGDLVELTVGAGEPEPVLAVPLEAVVEVNGQDLVFVQVAGESFARRRVELGRRDGEWVEILSGVDAGERVVAIGGFDVHVASLSSALDSHTH